MNNKIVLITGAGASKELNISCGKDFLWEMASRLCTRYNTNIVGGFIAGQGKYLDMINQFLKYKKIDLKEATYSKFEPQEAYWINKINDFKNQFEDYIHNESYGTIDYFLQNAKDKKLVEIGKFALSFHLIGYEDAILKDNCYESKPNWLKIFVEKYIKEIYNNKELNFKIITFNYDRTIEHFIYQHLTEELLITEIEAVSFINCRLEVIHIYGKIGNLEWQDKTSFIKFGEKNDNSIFVDYAIKNVQLIGTRIEPEVQNRIDEILSNASKVIFLGYGFDSENNRLLNIDSESKIIYTKYGLSVNDENDFIERYNSNNKEGFNEKCFELLKTSQSISSCI